MGTRNKERCDDVLIMVFGLENIVILNIKSAYYKCIIWNMGRSDAVNRLYNSKLGDKGSS